MPNLDYSVVIATYNRAEHLEGCLRTFMDPAAEGLEVVVVDDGSTDTSPMLVRKLASESRGERIHLLQQSNYGVSVARNRGVAETRTPYVFFLDDDDRWFPWKVQAAQLLVSQTPEAAMVLLRIASFTDEAQLDSFHQMPLEVTSHASFFDFYLNPPISIYGSCNVGVRRDAFTSVGGFDPAFRSGGDIDLFFRMSAQGRIMTAVAPVLVGNRANTSGSLSKNSKQQMQGAQLVLGRYMRGELVGSPKIMQSAMARFVLIRFWTLLNRGETALAGQFLRAAAPILKTEMGLYFLVHLHLVLLKRRLFSKEGAIVPA